MFLTVRALLVHVEGAVEERHSLQLVLRGGKLTAESRQCLLRVNGTLPVSRSRTSPGANDWLLITVVSILPQGNFTLTVSEFTRLHAVLILVVQNLL